MDSKTSIEQLKKNVKSFCEDRDWDQFHNAKDLAIGAVTEASELLEHFRFLSNAEVEASLLDKDKRIAIGEELADVLFFILRFAQKYDFELDHCFNDKMIKNNLKYPIDKFKGKNNKSKIEI
jgi:NTP pyrophosphatase (non-canonical NTP hydrolase)